MGARYVAVDRVARGKRSKKTREGWAAVAIVCKDRMLSCNRAVEGQQQEVERMMPGGKRDGERHNGETEHDAAIRYLTEQTGITEADCGKWLLDVPIAASSAYGARYFVYQVSRWEWTTEMAAKLEQNGLKSEWVKFSKADEQASVRPNKWRRWSAARREEHQGRMWDHIKGKGEEQAQVQAGTGQVEVAKECSGAQMQETGEAAVTREVRATGETIGRRGADDRQVDKT